MNKIQESSKKSKKRAKFFRFRWVKENSSGEGEQMNPLTGREDSETEDHGYHFSLKYLQIRLAGVRLAIYPRVFIVSTVLIALVSLLVLFYPEQSKALLLGFQHKVIHIWGWWLILCGQMFLVVAIYIGVSRFGHIRLGGWDARPQYSNISWFSMMFSAGMGIGILFYGVVEPMSHYLHPPQPGLVGKDAISVSMMKTFLHWGMHAWAIYALLGLALAFFSYNKGLPFSLRSILRPLLGSHVEGWLGDLIDILAILTTAFGVATSLGLGVSQMSAGLSFLTDISDSVNMKVFLIVVVTIMATFSASSGIQRGVKWLSNMNIFIMLFLLFFVFIMGPTGHLAGVFVQSVSQYYQSFFAQAGWTAAYQEDKSWLVSWTFFYWAWWISWSPFVGIFIARISYGRTIREFIVGVLLVPPLLIFLWFSIFGGYAQYLDFFQGNLSIRHAMEMGNERPLFVLLSHLPFFKLTASLTVFSLIVFYITSADSCAIVMDTIASGGQENTPTIQRVLWSLLVGILALVFLFGKALVSLQAGVIAIGGLFSLVLVLLVISLLRSLQRVFPAYKMFSGVEEGDIEEEGE